jgi:hypothetical protein
MSDPTPKTVSELIGVNKQDPVMLEQMSAAAKRLRYLELRSKLGRSRLQVHGDPNMHYFWADRGDHSEIARLEGVGYSIVREPRATEVLHGEAKPKISANGLREDGSYVVGDVILTQCSMETYEFLMLATSERHEELALGAQRDFRTEAESLAVPVFDHNAKGK